MLLFLFAIPLSFYITTYNGVDINNLAVQLGKLSLWLISASKDKPLSFIDHHLKSGNSLVGANRTDIDNTLGDNIAKNMNRRLFDVTINNLMSYIDSQFITLEKMPEETADQIHEKEKFYYEDIQGHLKDIKTKWDIYLAMQINDKKGIVKKELYDQIVSTNLEILEQNYPSFKEWAELAKANQFFHWELEFPEVFNGNNKGFDCIIGNPPYGAKLNLILKQFFIKKYKSAQNFETEFWKTKGSLDTYSLFVDSTVHLLNKKSKFGYIVPMAIMSGDSVSSLHEVLFKKINILKISSYSSRPSRIFPNADQRVSIILGYSNGEKIQKLETTKINKRYKTASINDIIENLEYINSFEFYKFGRIPKMGKEIEINVLKKIFQNGMQIQKIKKDNGSSIFYRTSGGRYYNIITPYPTGSSKEKEIKFENEINLVVGAALSSNIFYWYQQLYTNTLDLKSFEINMFPVPNNNLTEKLKKKIIQKYEEYLIDIEKNCLIKNKKYSNTENIKEKEYSIRKSRNLILELDQLLGEAYELTNEEIEFIKNYDIKFRTDEQE